MVTPQQAAFGETIVEQLRRLGHTDARLDQDTFRVAIAGGHVQLTPLWDQRGEALFTETSDKWVLEVSTLEAPDADPAIARSRLRPRLSPVAMHTRLALEGRLVERPYMPPGGALTDDLVVDVVYDFPTRRTPVSDAALHDWGLSREVALDLAVAQLHREATFVERSPGLFTTEAIDGSAASLLLWAHEASRPSLALRGDPVFLPLRDDVLYIAGDDDPAALTAMMASALRVGSTLSATPLRFDGIGFVPYTDVDSAALGSLQRAQASRAYRLAYGSVAEALLTAVYGMHQAVCTDVDGKLLAVPTGWPCLIPMVDRVQVGEALLSMSDVGAPAEPVGGLEPKVWLCPGPTSTAADT